MTTLKDPQIFYGRVCTFLSYPADSPDSTHVALIEELEVKRCPALMFLPEIQSLASLV